MLCKQCKYVLSDFDEKCPRCGFNPSTDTLKPPEREYVVRNTKPSPSKSVIDYQFPEDGTARVTRNGQNYGPYSLEEINHYLKMGNLLQSDRLLTDNNEWVVLRRIQGIILPPPVPLQSSPPPPSAHLQTHTPSSFPVNQNNSVQFLDTDKSLTEQEKWNINSLSALGFIFPIVGLIMFIYFSNINATKASIIGKWSLIGFLAMFVIWPFIFFFFSAMFFATL